MVFGQPSMEQADHFLMSMRVTAMVDEPEAKEITMAIENVNVSVADDCLDRFPAVVRAAEKAGLKVEQALEIVGIVSGSIESAKLEDLARVPGVAAVERSRGFQLPPPDSEIQ
jgi:hypothetical protein